MNKRKRLVHIVLYFLMIGNTSTVFCQQFSFTNYSVENGLVQSQAQDIQQDKYGYLWVATLGGISRFDGISFNNYGRKEGMRNLFAHRIFTLQNGRVLFAAQGVIQEFDGKKFNIFATFFGNKNELVADLVESSGQEIFFRTFSGRIGVLKVNREILFQKKWDGYKVTALTTDINGKVYISVHNKGIYVWENQQWQLVSTQILPPAAGMVKKLLITREKIIYVLTSNASYKIENNKWIIICKRNINQFSFISLTADNKKNIWIGTTRGAIRIDINGSIKQVGLAEGLTNNSIYQIRNDREGNLWFASDGSGIFRLNNSPIKIITSAQGLKGSVVMGINKTDKGIVWLGTADGGLQQFNGETIQYLPIPSKITETQKVNTLFTDTKKQLWIGTLNGGTWKYDGKEFLPLVDHKGDLLKTAVAFAEDNTGGVWITTPNGLYRYEKNNVVKIRGINEPCFGMLALKDSSLLIGSVSGIWMIDKNNRVHKLQFTNLQLGTVNALVTFKHFILIGTDNEGVFFWDRQNKRMHNCNTKNGLASDFIFSILNDSDSLLYIGTGRGISKVSVNQNIHFDVHNYAASIDKLYGPECNLNAVEKMNDGKIWFGTTGGVLIFDPTDTVKTISKPYIYLHGIELFSKPLLAFSSKDTLLGWHFLPTQPVLAHDQNQLSFHFSGIFLSNPSLIKYQYKLEGIDSNFSAPTTIDKVIYTQIPPGKYTFKAIALTDDIIVSENSINYPFEIRAPFYQSIFFQFLMVLLLVLLGVLIQYFNTAWKTKRVALLEKVRAEEQRLMRERTSEDLHDDLGNKITRITVLADVLNRKLDDYEEDKLKIISQIKENAQALYLGTKDFIWSLEPGKDSLYDLVDRCHSFAIHLFEETDIVFKLNAEVALFKDIKIPFELSRNIMMVVKEALNNVLKYSKASLCELSFDLNNAQEITVCIVDNGKGFDANLVKKGKGLANIQKRADRVQATCTIISAHEKGVQIEIKAKIPPFA